MPTDMQASFRPRYCKTFAGRSPSNLLYTFSMTVLPVASPASPEIVANATVVGGKGDEIVFSDTHRCERRSPAGPAASWVVKPELRTTRRPERRGRGVNTPKPVCAHVCMYLYVCVCARSVRPRSERKGVRSGMGTQLTALFCRGGEAQASRPQSFSKPDSILSTSPNLTVPFSHVPASCLRTQTVLLSGS